MIKVCKLKTSGKRAFAAEDFPLCQGLFFKGVFRQGDGFWRDCKVYCSAEKDRVLVVFWRIKYLRGQNGAYGRI